MQLYRTTEWNKLEGQELPKLGRKGEKQEERILLGEAASSFPEV